MKEVRNTIELRADGKRLIGYAAKFGPSSHDLGGFTETVAQGAFTRTLANGGDVVALYDHDKRSILGRTKSGTLRLSQDDQGLRFEIDTPNTTLGRDVLEMVGRGDVSGASFAFTVKEDRWHDNNTRRELIDVDLFDVTITPNPAYPDATVARRSLKLLSPDAAYRARALQIMGLMQ